MGFMADAATIAKAKYNEFRQSHLHGINGGECFGLSNAWLGYQARGASAFFTEIHLNQGKLRKSVQDYQRRQATPAAKTDVAAENRLQMATGKETQRLFYVRPNEGQRSLADLSAWACSTGFTARYFLVEADTHTMAMVAGGVNDKRFFDPNAGVAICSNGTKLTHFLREYFDLIYYSEMKESYWPQGNGRLQVTKLKKM